MPKWTVKWVGWRDARKVADDNRKNCGADQESCKRRAVNMNVRALNVRAKGRTKLG
jgi:hypothetical protein